MVWLIYMNQFKRRELEQVKPADTLGLKGKGLSVGTQVIPAADVTPSA